MTDKVLINVNNVSFTYPAIGEEENERLPNRPVLKNVSIGIKEGEFLCIVGRNGSGKSTLAKLLNGLLVPCEGSVTVDGIDTTDEKNITEIRRRVGMVFQNPDNQIIASSVEDDVAFGLENIGIPREEMLTRVDEALRACGIEALRKTEPHLLSGGQKQRVAIAGILAMRPRCIVLDESTAMLDPKGRRDVLEITHRLNREEGITIVLITHHMDETASADRVMLINNGELLKTGTPRELFSDAELVEASGLELPVTARLFHEVYKEGIELPCGVLTAAEGVEVIGKLNGYKA